MIPLKAQTSLVAGGVCMVALIATAAAAGPWDYVVPPPGDRFEHPPLRALPLSDDRPLDLQEKASFRGSKRQYAQVSLGSPGSLPVALVLDHVSDREIDLYVDFDRNRAIEAQERVVGAERTWRTTLGVAVFRGKEKPELVPRNVIFQLSRAGRTLRFAVCGYVEGNVSLDGHSCPARRTDGDGNGFLADTQDRLWIDLNGDGKWDPIDEQFLFAPVLVLGAKRYVVRSDELGQLLTLAELQGTGTVKLALGPELAPRVTELTMVLVGRDGSVVSLRGDGTAAALPVGEYRPNTATISRQDPAGGLAWNYVFSSEGQRQEPVWYKVEKDGKMSLDPIGSVRIDAVLMQQQVACVPGGTVKVQPCLQTQDGLVIATMYRGETMSRDSREGFRGRVNLVTPAGVILDSAATGFG